ncbi:antibiotic biosynthesis monooxygenase [Sedimentitalea sp. JM2-8]|uniref:Antibiotic biosynthesis monooxygenase n=1 Tax=Sedimentitalea xiamensis TaxID=3050037 RepID=A0ABT7FCE3_9RHOB|nr:antibiotic biosynthesis monooxygenase [Sedimentitalea xiamensis]MDK3072787.1 antibiotic biosynthesis monooxygenase [Sedimentitalea xiamensis]
MHTLTAIIRARKGSEDLVRAELLKVGVFAAANEPGTVGFFVAQDPDDPCLFTTYERFTDKAAMDAHNNGAASQGFFAAAGERLDGDVTVVTAVEVWPE